VRRAARYEMGCPANATVGGWMLDNVRAASGRSSAIRAFRCKSGLYGAIAWARRTLKRRFPAPRAAACLVHDLLLQTVTSPRFTILNGFRPPGAGLRDPQRLHHRDLLPPGPLPGAGGGGEGDAYAYHLDKPCCRAVPVGCHRLSDSPGMAGGVRQPMPTYCNL
jgi:hypothetical protein